MGFSDTLKYWYKRHKRELPWRSTNDPYHVWLSEIILQQTRVAQGMPYYLRMIEAFPNVEALANSEEKQVLSLWQGLGYYSRGRNLHHCANQVVHDYGGVFPNTAKELQKLKGIGKYTSAAISSICFNEAIPVIDGNVYRVISRYLNLDQDISASTAYGVFEEALTALIDKQRPGDFNQSMMEFGALQCTPKNPNCQECPLMDSCEAFRLKIVEKRPVKTKKVKVKKRFFDYTVIATKEGLLFKERKNGDIWSGLYDFPLTEVSKFEEYPENPLVDEIRSLSVVEHTVTKPIKHILTHQVIQARFQLFETSDKVKHDFIEKYGLKCFSFAEIEELPKPVLINNYLKSEPEFLDLI